MAQEFVIPLIFKHLQNGNTNLSNEHIPMKVVPQRVVDLLQRHGVDVAQEVVVLLLFEHLQVQLLKPGRQLRTKGALTEKNNLKMHFGRQI